MGAWEIDGGKLWIAFKNNVSLLFETINSEWDVKNSMSQVDKNNVASFSITWTFQFPREIIKSEMEKNWFIFHDQPRKDTDFLLCGEKAWLKRKKAEILGIKIHESRDEIIEKFPFLWNLKIEERQVKTWKSNQPSQMSLF